MSARGERARRRAEQERAAALAAAERERAALRLARRRARVRRLTGWLPRRRPAAGGALAARRRRRVRGLVAVLVLVNLAVWLLVPDWSARLGILVVSVLVAPVAYTVLFRR